MKPRWAATFLLVLLVLALMGFSLISPAQAAESKQIPTVNIPTVTGTPSGPIVTVRLDLDLPQINVRNGPGTFYDRIGVLVLGQKTPAKGRSPGGSWIMIEYPGVPGGIGWVSVDLINITPGELPVVEPPATPTPLVTATINPSLAAKFQTTSQPSRLPTYTQPAPLTIPTFVSPAGADGNRGIPIGLIILALGALGLIVGVISFAQGR